MMDEVRICAVTVHYKNTRDTVKCVQSLRASTLRMDVVVVDNSPMDPDLESALCCTPGIAVIRAPMNLGFGGGNNLGVRAACTMGDYDYVFLLNSDATVEPTTVRELIESARSRPTYSIFAPRIVLMADPSVLWYGGGDLDRFRVTARVPGMLGPADSPSATTSREVSFVSGCAVLFRTSAWKLLGGFDERFFMYEEDLDLCFRAQEHGVRLWYQGSAVVRHVGGGATDEHSRHAFVDRFDPRGDQLGFFIYHSVRGRIINIRKHCRGIWMLISSIGVALFMAYKGLIFIGHRRLRAIKSMIDGVKSGLAA